MQKKIFFSLCVLILMTSIVRAFTDEPQEMQSTYDDVKYSIEKIQQTQSVNQLSAFFDKHDFSLLSYNTRRTFYTQNAKDISFPYTFSGFGLSSLRINHTAGFVYGLTTDIIFVTSAFVGVAFIAIIPIIVITSSLANGDIPWYTFGMPYIGLAGLGCFFVNRFVQMAIVTTYRDKFNATLRRGLGLNDDLTDALDVTDINFYPIIQPFAVNALGIIQKGQYGIGCRIQL